MAQLVKVFVCDKNGRGIQDVKVNLYNGAAVFTDEDGIAEVFVNGSTGTCSIYVDGSTAYDGYISGLPSLLTFKK